MSDKGQTPEECRLMGKSCTTCQNDCIRGISEEDELHRHWLEQQAIEDAAEAPEDDMNEELEDEPEEE